MSLGAALWTSREAFYNGLTLARDGITLEQQFAARPALMRQFPQLEAFWKRHVCPATMRPHSQAFRPGISAIAEKVARASYSVVGKLLDADDSLAKVLAGDLGPRYRNWRDAIEAAGNALQLTTELQFAVADKKAKKPTAASLAGRLGMVLDPFPDWKTHWAADRDKAAAYRNYLVHEGLVYTVTVQPTGEVLVLGPAGFGAGVSWMQADASYTANPGHWRPLAEVAQAVLGDTMAFIDLTYGRLIRVMDPLLVSPAYQALWGWTAAPAQAMVTSTGLAPAPANTMVSLQACSASKTVGGNPAVKTIISSGGCNE